MNNNPMQRESLFWTPEYVDISAWIEHIPFAFWLIDIVRPASIVELGVHNGTSYFACCEAVKRLNINTACYGIDTWQGDEHSGFYGDEVFEKVSKHNSFHYSRFSTLIRSTFDEAKEYFADHSVDLLHIDGLHTYEAVKHDFEAWLPKLGENAFVMFHDINVRERGFGVFRLWEELKQKYDYLQFDFGYGLGVIALGKIKQDELRSLFKSQEDIVYYNFLRNLFAERGNFFKLNHEHSRLITRKINEHELLSTAHSQLNENYKTLESHYLQLTETRERLTNEIKELSDNYKTLESHYHQLIETRERLGNQNRELDENYKTLESHYHQLIETRERLGNENKQLTERYNALELFNTELRENKNILTAANEQLNERIRTLVVHHKQLEELLPQFKHANEEIKKYKEDNTALENELEKDRDTLNELHKTIEHQKHSIRWYKETYEDRSILGTLKEKIRQLFKKKKVSGITATAIVPLVGTNNKSREMSENADLVVRPKNGENFELRPANDIVVFPDSQKYSCVGSDPYFHIDLKNKRLRKGWYLLSIDITLLNGMLIIPKIYYDYGSGFNEEDVWNLPEIANGKIECLVNFPFDISALRFDPSSIDCTLEIRSFNFKGINKISVLRIAISEYKKIHAPNDTYFAVLKDFFLTFLKTGRKGLRLKVWNAIALKNTSYEDKYKKWCALFDTISERQFETVVSSSGKLNYRPLFSVVMPVYNAPVRFLKKAIESVRNQAYDNWELCIADDKSTNKEIQVLLSGYASKDNRIKVVFREVNGHISKATNSALELVTGDYIALLDQDDELARHSLFMAADAINRNRRLQLIYSDEDKIDEYGTRFDPYFKTDWNKDLFYGQNMISHLGVYKTSLVKKVGGFRAGYEGSQDYDLALRCIEHLAPDEIYHIPHVLYHWRAIKGSTALAVSNKNYAYQAGLKALRDHLIRMNLPATAEENVYSSYRVKWNLPREHPMVSIIIPTKDKLDVLENCISSVLNKTKYKNFEILIINNNSSEPSTIQYFQKIQQGSQVKVYNYEKTFNFSAIVNYGVKQSKGDVVLLLNNDTQVINGDWLHEMVSQCMREEIGAVGAKLFYPNGQIQHAGVFLYEGHPGNHIYLKRNRDDLGYFNKLNLVQNYSAVTAACLAIRKQLYLKAGGFDEQNLKVAYNDVDFCLRVRELGYTNLWTPFAQLVHFESLSRGNDLDEINYARFKKEHSYMLNKMESDFVARSLFQPQSVH